jgi:hypothetical protein
MVNPNQIVTGNFRTVAGSKFNFAAVQNSDGVSGDWQINSVSLGQFYLQSICVNVVGNEATIAGIITEVISGNFQKNWIVYLKVKDNGEGGKAMPDQVTSQLLYYPNWFNFYPTAEDFLVDYPCSLVGTSPAFGAFGDRDGQIQVR